MMLSESEPNPRPKTTLKHAKLTKCRPATKRKAVREVVRLDRIQDFKENRVGRLRAEKSGAVKREASALAELTNFKEVKSTNVLEKEKDSGMERQGEKDGCLMEEVLELEQGNGSHTQRTESKAEVNNNAMKSQLEMEIHGLTEWMNFVVLHPNVAREKATKETNGRMSQSEASDWSLEFWANSSDSEKLSSVCCSDEKAKEVIAETASRLWLTDKKMGSVMAQVDQVQSSLLFYCIQILWTI